MYLLELIQITDALTHQFNTSVFLLALPEEGAKKSEKSINSSNMSKQN